MSLNVNNAFLTGGAEGLGKGFTEVLLASGARVVFGDINPRAGEATEIEFGEKYGRDRVRFIHFDVTDGPKFEEAFRSAVAYLGYIDLMVNNAGIMVESVWEKMIQINYTGVVRGTQLATEHMRKDRGGRGGRIVNLSSEMGLHNVPNVPAYCATKHAVRGYTSSLAWAPGVRELGIQYGLLCPSPADTQLTTKMDETRVKNFSPDLAEAIVKRMCSVERIQTGFKKLLRLDDMNGAILYVQYHKMEFNIVQKHLVGENFPAEKYPGASIFSSKPVLKTKHVFLTGGAQGLGKSYVGALLAAGARVVFSDVNAKVGAATEKEFAEKYGYDRVRFLEFDCTDGSKFEEAFQTAVAHLGYVDLMVNNAGFMIESLWEKMIRLNLTAMIKGTYIAYEHMRKDRGGRGGRIINVSSESGLHNEFLVPVYCGTKQGIRSFTTCLARAQDARAVGIEYGVLCPGPAATDLIIEADSTKVRHLEALPKNHAKKVISPVQRVTNGFMKLALLEDMNKAILYVSKDEMNFYEMRRDTLGESWPVERDVSFLPGLPAPYSKL